MSQSDKEQGLILHVSFCQIGSFEDLKVGLDWYVLKLNLIVPFIVFDPLW